jgi:uncharacterized GH25 family protein
MAMKSIIWSFLTVLFAFGGGFTVRAHNIWIEETSGKGLGLRFGEPGEVVETSPGRLDNFKSVRAWTVATNQFEVSKQKDHFSFAKANATEVVLAEDQGLAVSSRGGQPARKPVFYARWQPAKAGPGAPALTLDVVPEAQPGVVRIYFRGEPLADAKVMMRSIKGGEETELTADKHGRVHFKPGGKGGWLFTCAHREATKGFAGGLAYEGIGHNCTLTLMLP